ncbi:nucleotide exchange factor GrpE [Mycolicibacterium litorale]|uniref:Protein GrpE n=1 Tax=Mycolicibacterium litorale TaxID=758802 RepID=A0AAD1INB9_9MYCO|nr:nucleotide exchange factor GrpE [Mycolicibacterium litorale]MCV7416870.1 nucleotide exchange factor GrpE [Mycolicibacterium litorale]TDY04655.1 molecular chaperone GrpE [Mycolicibacterium litorale]BBY18081.1 protein GrpE [Mycolicibacterium litorale]
MTRPHNGENEPQEPVTVTDKRRIDPVTGEIRDPATASAPGAAQAATSSGPAPDPAPASATDTDEVAELKSTLQRVKAEYDNYRKRTLRDQQMIADRAKVAVVSQLLGVLDDLERARSHGDLESGPLKSVADKLAGALEQLGLTAFGEEGDEFDPSLHEAVQHEGDGTHPVVGTVMRRGYKVGEQVVRHAMVGVVDTVPSADTAENGSAPSALGPESSPESDNR